MPGKLSARQEPNREARKVSRAKRTVARAATTSAKRASKPLHAVGKEQFATILRAAMAEKGMGPSALVKRVKELHPDNKISPVLVSQYRAGRSIPRPGNLNALSRALGIDLSSYEPRGSRGRALVAPSGQEAAPPLETCHDVPTSFLSNIDNLSSPPELFIQARGDRVLVQINQELPWPVGLALLSALKVST